MNFALADETTEETPVNNTTETKGEEAQEPDEARLFEVPLGDGEGSETPLPAVVQSNTQLVSELIDFQKTTERSLKSLREEVTASHDDNGKVRKRVETLETRITSIVTQVNELSRVTRTLITLSELAETATCPECTESPLERQTSMKHPPRVVCTNPECTHVAATLE